jgi:hypothetical protein
MMLPAPLEGQLGQSHHHWCLQERAGALIRDQQAFDFLPERLVSSASSFQIRATFHRVGESACCFKNAPSQELVWIHGEGGPVVM